MLLPGYPTSARKAKPLPSELLAFVRQQDGGLTLFSLFIFIMMLLMAGMAVDLMRFETKRTALQNTIDGAVLAAANLDQEADSETLVRDFFEKSGFDGSLVNVTATEERIGEDENGEGGELVGRTVQATHDIDVNTYFMGLLGIDELRGASTGRASESTQNVEISLIVDISGSMGGSKLSSLKTAANNFLNIVLDDTVQDPEAVERTSISVIPYHATVVVPDELLSRLTGSQANIDVLSTDQYYADPDEFDGAVEAYTREADNSKCILWSNDQMTTTDLTTDYLALRQVDASTQLERVGYFDENGKSSGSGDSYSRPADDGNRWCDPTRTPIMIHETDKTKLSNHINGLTASGWTSIDQGMKWGVALMDPAMRPIINDMVDNNILSEDVRNRPGDYIGTETMKVVVVMTDGANTINKDLETKYKRGPSPVWFSPSLAGANFLEDDDTNSDYWDGYLVQIGEERDDDVDYWYQPEQPWNRNDGAYLARGELPDDAQQLTWQALYNRLSENAVRWLFRDATWQQDDELDDYFFGEMSNNVIQTFNNSSLDERLNGTDDDAVYGICDIAKEDNDMIVFSIAFNVGTNSNPEKQMKACATSEGYYFDADTGAELDEAFQAIAGQITKLRLTQ